MSKKSKRIWTIVGVVAILGTAGCIKQAVDPEPSTPTPSPTVSVSPTPTPSASETPEITTPEISRSISEVMQVSENDLVIASSSIEPLVAVEGRYIVADGYKFHDTLTVFELETGETVHFISSGGPFTSSGAPANEYTRDLTGFVQGMTFDSPGGIEASRMMSDLSKYLD